MSYRNSFNSKSLESVSDVMSEETGITTSIGRDGRDIIEDQLVRNMSLKLASKWQNYCCSQRVEKHKTDCYREGPAPVEDTKKTVSKASYGTLDSDVEDLEFEDMRQYGTPKSEENPYNKKKVKINERGYSIASCRALIVYFAKLSQTKDENEIVDLNFVESLLENNADINFSDKHGQTIMHEIARAWNPDVAKFALQNGANIHKKDSYGRSPLHLAAAADYDDMVEFLIQNGANLGSITFNENQTPMHYAAKYNATASLKTMLRLGASINDRDYKRRTPLFVAAETARAEAARCLIEQGAPAGVYDSSGSSSLALMIEKMPQVAIDAVEQFHLIDRAFRKHYYYLSYLEPDPKYLDEPIPETERLKKERKERLKEEKRLMKEQGKKIKKGKTYAKTPLEVIVQYNQLDLIMHPVFQRLLKVKWNLFAKWGSWRTVIINLFYTLIWTILGIFIPRGDVLNYYSPVSSNWWRIVLETIGVLLTIYFIFTEISELQKVERSHNRWRQWRTLDMEKDLNYCHPRWPEEKKYVESELAQIRTYQRTYFREPWNIFEWISYVVVLTLILTRVLAELSADKRAEAVHPKIYAVGLIVLWLRFMRSCRPFQSLGPFIAILGSVITDTMKFAFLFFEFFIPYVVGFWIVFGGSTHAKTMDTNPEADPESWEKFNDLIFSVWTITLMGDFDFAGLATVDRLMAQILCGTYFALVGVVCMNLYIALLSDTFARVYGQAQANAVMQLAQTVISLEKKLGKKNRLKFAHYMQDECSPEEVYSREEGHIADNHDNDRYDKVTRQIVNRIDETEDFIKNSKNFAGNIDATNAINRRRFIKERGPDMEDEGNLGVNQLMNMLQKQTERLQATKEGLDEIKFLLHQLFEQSPPLPKISIQHERKFSSQPELAIMPQQNLVFIPSPQPPSCYNYFPESNNEYPPAGIVRDRSYTYNVLSDTHLSLNPNQNISSKPGSVQSNLGGNNKRIKNTNNPLIVSWDDIRNDLHI